MNEITRPAPAAWRKSIRSGETANCVEVAAFESGAARAVGVRDSKNPAAGHLAFGATAWADFVDAIKQERHDLG